MKTKIIRALALTLTLFTLLSVLSACGGNEGVGTSTEAPADNSKASVNGVSLDNFTIVCENNEDYLNFAKKLQNTIKNVTGYELELVADNEDLAETEYEILIGNVEREATKEFYASDYRYYNIYNVLVSGKKVALMAKNALMVRDAIEAFTDKYFTTEALPARITDGTVLTGDIYATKNVAINKRINDTDIRIAANNIYFHQKDTSTEIDDYAYRKPYLLQNFSLFDADILMLQEASYDRSISPTKNTWRDILDPELEAMGYTYVPADPKTKLYENYTPIWYNAERVTLIDSKYFLFSSVKELPDGSISHSKSYTMAVFEDNTTKSKFACISTHFTWAGTEEQATRLKKLDATETVAEVLELRKTYGEDFPIILMGDLNSAVNSDPYTILAKELKNVRLTAGVKKNNIGYGTTHDLGSLPSNGGGVIDHTLYSGTANGFKPVQYQHVINQWSSHSTDHIPLIVDIVFE